MWPKMIASSGLKFVDLFYDSNDIKSRGMSAGELSALAGQTGPSFTLPHILHRSSREF